MAKTKRVPLETLSLKNRRIRFWIDYRMPENDPRNRRLHVSVSEEEQEAFLKKGLTVKTKPDGPVLIVRIPSGEIFTHPTGLVNLELELFPWTYKEYGGTIAYLTSCTSTMQVN